MSRHLFLHTGLALCLVTPAISAQDPHTGMRDGARREAPVSAGSELLKGSSLIGKSVKDANNEDCAEVRDLLVRDDGKVCALLLEVPDVEDSLVIVPTDAVTPRTKAEKSRESDDWNDDDSMPYDDDTSIDDGDVYGETEDNADERARKHPARHAKVAELESLMLTVDKSKLTSAPRISTDDENREITKANVKSAYDHFGISMPMESSDERSAYGDAADTSYGDKAEEKGETKGRTAKVRKLNKAFCRASEYMDREVANTADEDLGEIEDLAISLRDDRVAYAVLSRGGVMGLGDKRFAVPFKSLHGNGDRSAALEADIDVERLEQHEGFERWPATADNSLINGERPSSRSTDGMDRERDEG